MERDRAPPQPPAPDAGRAGLRALAAQLMAGAPDPASPPPLKSVALFRDRWTALRAQRRLALELPPPPENAGPLNSQRLLHEALQSLRATSPAYLLHLAQYMEALGTLEQAMGMDLGPAPARPAATAKASTGAAARPSSRTPRRD